MVNRRQFLKAAGAAALAPALTDATRAAAGRAPSGMLDPVSVPKYAADLFALPAMPRSGADAHLDRYRVAVRPHRQQVLPPGYPATPVFAYGSTTDPATFHWPGYAIEARVDRPVQVTWRNELVTPTGHFVPPLLPVDPTLHWANPPGGRHGRDTRPVFHSTPRPYRGPVPVVTHLHGAHVTDDSDGFPQAWYLPAARDIPAGYARVGSSYDEFAASAHDRHGVVWEPGAATYHYRNDQRATMLWYHGHELGMTRVSMQCGLAGVYLLRGGDADLAPGILPAGRHELPLVIQDRSFHTDGTLAFPSAAGMFFGNVMVVNGRTWPKLTVAPRRYRLRLLNASNARTVFLKLVTDPRAARPARPRLPFWIIGSDGGLLPAPVESGFVRLGPAERADVIVDLTHLPEGTALYLVNEGPDWPYGGGVVNVDYEPADPRTTGQVMKFVVGPPDGPDHTVPPARLDLPPVDPIGRATRTRRLSLNGMRSMGAPALLGVLGPAGRPEPMRWMDPVTEKPALGATETWELHNFTMEGHPVHLHQVQFQVVDRRPFRGPARGPERWEHGFKDTLIALPGEITRLRARFDLPGRYAWHCHILDHEDDEMMRPYVVGG